MSRRRDLRPREAEDSTAEHARARELVARISGGDSTAEEELVRHYSGIVIALLARRAASVADDLYQETFRIVIERLRARGLLAPEALASFIYGTTLKLLQAEARRRARHAAVELSEGLSDPRDTPLHHALRRERCQRVRRALGALRRRRDRELLVRLYLAGEDRAVVRRHLGVSELQFNRILFRARKRLRAIYDDIH